MLVQSPLNYTGGKFKLLPQLLPLFPKDINRVFDLFTGGGNVIANIPAKQKIACDIDDNVIGILNLIKNEENLLEKLRSLALEYNLNKNAELEYYKLRDDYNSKPSSMKLFLLIIHSFNSQIRFNKKGEFNIPVGKRDLNSRLSKKIVEFAKLIQDVEFRACDFFSVLDEVEQGDFIYCDPPYILSEATYNKSWNENHELRLLEFLDKINAKGAKFALSNVLTHKGLEHNLLKEWAKGRYEIVELNYKYSNCSYQFSHKDKISLEVLVKNY